MNLNTDPRPAPHSCLHHGHVWLESDGTLYVRHRDRTGTTDVSCLYCDTNASLSAHGKATAPFTNEQVAALAFLMRDDTLAAKIRLKTSAPAKIS